LKDISFDESMTRAMAVKAEADRNAQAKLINAEADIQTAELYSKAAKIYSENPITLRLREFQLWNSVSKNPNNTIYVVPSSLLDKIGR
jgi:regulator of protease activity HflC (stomatin/prohibitin superfamily)